MGYYIRVLGIHDPDIHIDELIDSLKEEGLSAKFQFDPTERPQQWTMLDIENNDGKTLAQIERNPVVEGQLGKEELDEFKEMIEDCKPTSAVTWLTNYFEKVKVIYAFQILNAAFDDNNFDVISSIKTKIWNKTAGILQADNEGFSNEDGFHILWQFAENVTGDWSCAVQNSAGQWKSFVMDLGSKTQRQEFMNGQVPTKSIRL